MIKVYPERLINEPEYIGKSIPLENLCCSIFNFIL